MMSAVKTRGRRQECICNSAMAKVVHAAGGCCDKTHNCAVKVITKLSGRVRTETSGIAYRLAKSPRRDGQAAGAEREDYELKQRLGSKMPMKPIIRLGANDPAWAGPLHCRSGHSTETLPWASMSMVMGTPDNWAVASSVLSVVWLKDETSV